MLHNLKRNGVAAHYALWGRAEVLSDIAWDPLQLALR